MTLDTTKLRTGFGPFTTRATVAMARICRGVPIAKQTDLAVPDSALRTLRTRFETEHRAQSFGYYSGNEQAGDVLPALER